MELVLTGELIPASDLYNFGLFTRIVPEATVVQEAFELAKNIAGKSPIATRLAKEAVNSAFEVPLSEGLKIERQNFFLTFFFRRSKRRNEGLY